MSSPSKITLPEVTSSSRVSSRAVVLLPQPALAHDPERLPAAHLEVDAVDRLHGPDLALDQEPARDREVLDEPFGAHGTRRGVGGEGVTAGARPCSAGRRRSCGWPGEALIRRASPPATPP